METSSKMASTLIKNGFENPLLCQKAQNFVYFRSYDFVQISQARGTNIFKECIERLWITNVSISNGSRKENGKCTAKIDFPIGYFMVPLLMLTWGV